MRFTVQSSLIFSLLFTATSTPTLHAYETDYGYDSVEFSNKFDHSFGKRKRKQVSEIERQRRFALALQALNIPPETAPDFSAYPKPNTLNYDEVMQNMRWLDPLKALKRYLNFDVESFSLYRAFFSNDLTTDYLEFSTPFKPQKEGDLSLSEDSPELISRLALVAQNTVKYPLSTQTLRGLKVLIDPGHMGPSRVGLSTQDEDWDHLTGKFVSVQGKTVSEGEINLHTALLLANELEALGAEVLLTRTSLGPASTESLDAYNVTPFIYHYFYNAPDHWMDQYLNLTGISDNEFKKIILAAPETADAFTKSKHDTSYYITGADLKARTDMISTFHPDITLDIHYDAYDSSQTQNSINHIDAFVPGTVMENETGSREMKALILKHMLDVRRWNESVELAGSITNAMSESLKVPLLNTPALYYNSKLSALKVRSGVHSRNLYVTSHATEGLIVYLECLHYDYHNEFFRLANKNNTASYHGNTFQYSSRIDDVVSGIKTGVLSYIANKNNDNATR